MTMTAFERRQVENLNPGYKTPDGAVFAGISPDTGKPFFAAAADESAAMDWEKARRTASLRSMTDGMRWRLPTDGEHNLMRRISGLFNQSGWYWSAQEVNRRKARTWNAQSGQFSEDMKFRPSLVRLVRD